MKRPRVLVTRTQHQASELAAQLAGIGTETILIPTIEVVAPSSFVALDAASDTLGTPGNEFDWLVFTSANAVHAMSARARQRGLVLYPKRTAAIGPATLKAIANCSVVLESAAVLLPAKYVAESLAETLLDAAEGSQRFLLVRAAEARDVIPAALEAAGHRVTVAAAYRNVTPPDTLPALEQLFKEKSEWPDAITFTSSSTARNLVEILQTVGYAIPPGIALASIGPITSATLRELGYEPSFEAEEPTIESLVAAISAHLSIS